MCLSTRCGQVSQYLASTTFSPQGLTPSLASSPFLGAIKRVSLVRRLFERQFACMPRQTIAALTHLGGGTARCRPRQRKGEDKVRESTGSLFQQRDERCLWSTHHIWCRRHHSPARSVVDVCVRRPLPPHHPPNNWFWSAPRHCLVVASREIKQER